MDTIVNLMMIGDSYTGKTSLLKRLKKEPFVHQQKSTLGIQSALKRLKYKEKIVKAKIWDVSGQIRDLENTFFNKADGFFVNIDLSDIRSLKHLNFWLRTVWNKFGKDFPVIVVGNKRDIKHINTTELKKNFDFIETSAKTYYNVERMIFKLYKRTIAPSSVG